MSKINKSSWAGNCEQRAAGLDADAAACRKGASQAKSPSAAKALLAKAEAFEAVARKLRNQAAGGNDRVVPERKAPQKVRGNVTHKEFVKNQSERRHSRIESAEATCRAQFRKTGRFELPDWIGRESDK